MTAIIISMDKVRTGRALAAAAHAQNVGVRLAAALEIAGITPAELSRILGVQPSVVSGWITGTFRPQLETLCAALPHLDVTLQYVLIGDTGGIDYVRQAALGDAETRIRAASAERDQSTPRRRGRPRVSG